MLENRRLDMATNITVSTHEAEKLLKIAGYFLGVLLFS
jgi:hypothetical protein